MDERRGGAAAAVGLLVLRVGIGGLLLTHGWGKLEMVLAGDFDRFGDPIGIGSGPSLVLATAGEFLGALLVVIGLGTRIGAALAACVMAVAAFVVHAADPWTMGEGARLFMEGEAERWSSKEPALLYLVPFLALVLTGPGRISLDALVRRAFRRSAS